MNRMILVSLLALSLMGCAGAVADFKAAAIDAGKQIAAEAAPIIAEKATEAGAKAMAAQVAKDDSLTPEEKDDITGTLYGAGGATLASLLAALRLWAMYRAKKLALGVVVKGVEALPNEVGDRVKEMVASMGGNAPAVKAAISSAKA